MVSGKNPFGLSTEGAGASNPSKGGKPSIDFRGPQEKGKPGFDTAHLQAVGGGQAGQPAKVPNRAGEVKIRRVQIDTPQGSPPSVHHGDYSVG